MNARLARARIRRALASVRRTRNQLFSALELCEPGSAAYLHLEQRHLEACATEVKLRTKTLPLVDELLATQEAPHAP